jgi:tRNA(Ile2) C34 agmatinyltransferase TiaS
MATCAWCHNEYDKTFDVTYDEKTYTFDSFECAITMLAPTCAQCGCRMIGHGNEVDGRFYCCASCARKAEPTDMHDRDSVVGSTKGAST